MVKKHKHHIIPRHAGGTDDPSNIVELTTEEHAEAHRKLYEEHGRWQDKIAWKVLSHQITAEEGTLLAATLGHTPESYQKTAAGLRGRVRTAEHRRNLSIAKRKNPKRWTDAEKAHFAETSRNVGPECRKARSEKMSKKIWVTNGVESKRVEVIPEGYWRGRLKNPQATI